MASDVERARQIADEDVAFGRFVVEVTLAGGLLADKAAREQDAGGISDGRFHALTSGFHDMLKAMTLCRADGAPIEAHQTVRQRLVDLAAQAMLLATKGDAAWGYQPEKGISS